MRFWPNIAASLLASFALGVAVSEDVLAYVSAGTLSRVAFGVVAVVTIVSAWKRERA